MRLTLKDEGYPYKKVMQGRKWIGRVYKTADGLWACDIYRRRVFTGASTALQAFQEGAAKHMGFEDCSTLQDHNRIMNRRNREQKAMGRALAQDMLSTDRQTREAAYDRLFQNLVRGEK